MWLTKWSRTPVSPSSSIFISPPLADITLLIKDHIVKAVVFPVVMYRCEIWTIRNAERRRIEAFKLWCWRRRLRIPWTAKRSNQSILKEINPEYLLDADAEASIFWPPDVKSRLIGKDPDVRKD